MFHKIWTNCVTQVFDIVTIDFVTKEDVCEWVKVFYGILTLQTKETSCCYSSR